MNTAAEILIRAKFDNNGFIPAIVQDARTREVLTLAYMNGEALRLTLERGQTYFFSRSRQKLWHKGETSGNFQIVRSVRLDCDADVVLVEVDPVGPACHTGSYSCFGVEPRFDSAIQGLYSLIASRREERPEGSYTTRLFDEGIDMIVKKLGEEAVETVIAAKNDSAQRLVEETSDLIYHLMVTLVEKGITLDEIRSELHVRHNKGKRN